MRPCSSHGYCSCSAGHRKSTACSRCRSKSRRQHEQAHFVSWRFTCNIVSGVRKLRGGGDHRKIVLVVPGCTQTRECSHPSSFYSKIWSYIKKTWNHFYRRPLCTRYSSGETSRPKLGIYILSRMSSMPHTRWLLRITAGPACSAGCSSTP